MPCSADSWSMVGSGASFCFDHVERFPPQAGGQSGLGCKLIVWQTSMTWASAHLCFIFRMFLALSLLYLVKVSPAGLVIFLCLSVSAPDVRLPANTIVNEISG